MTMEAYRSVDSCTFKWKIENISQWWWLQQGKRLESPAFVVEADESTRWALWLYPMGIDDKDSNVGIYLNREKDCSGPDVIEVVYRCAILDHNGRQVTTSTSSKRKFSKNDGWGFAKFEEKEKMFVSEKEKFVFEDTLTIQCIVCISGKKTVKIKSLFATTDIKLKRKSYVWRVDNFSTLKYDVRKFKDYLFGFELVYDKNLNLIYGKIISYNYCVKYISCKTSISIPPGEMKEYCGISKHFAESLEKGVQLDSFYLTGDRTRYLRNDSFTIVIEFVIATAEHFVSRKAITLEKDLNAKEKSPSIEPLIDFKSLYNDSTSSDIEVRTPTKTFPAHKTVLCSKSPVFMSMFSNDMKEKISGHVDITDFEDDTIQRMLLYMYTDSLEDLVYESASDLYVIADKYQILSLKGRCSSFLKSNLCNANACEVLVLGDLHNDDDLKSSARDYILRGHKKFFCSQEWKDFMSARSELAADIMYEKIAGSKIYLP